MAENMCTKILSAHLLDGVLKAGESIKIRIDQTLTQDATGTMAYLEFESMGIDRVRNELAVSYVDLVPVSPGTALRDLGPLEIHSACAEIGLDESRERAVLHEGGQHLDRQSEI